MKKRTTRSQQGFTLLELMIASVIGLIIMATMTSLFRVATNATFTVTQRAETQQNMRAAIELMSKDIGMAGAGLPSGGLQLASGGASSKIACNQTGTCYVTNGLYPNNNYMSGIIPGFGNGVQSNAVIPSAPGAVNDSITSIYCDYNFPLTNFNFSFNTPNSTQATVAVINNAVSPNNILAPGGLQVGDLLLFVVSTPGLGVASGAQGTSVAQTATAVAEITGLPAGGTIINFGAGDALNMNQNGPGSLLNAIGTFTAGTNLSVCRLFAVTYFLQVPPAGGTVQSPRLMRQVNGLNAVPVADNIINLQFTYDVINSNTSFLDANQPDPLTAGDNPALIQKVNMWVMGQGLVSGNNRSQSMYLASSVSTRNMSFCNSYSSNPNSTDCQ